MLALVAALVFALEFVLALFGVDLHVRDRGLWDLTALGLVFLALHFVWPIPLGTRRGGTTL